MVLRQKARSGALAEIEFVNERVHVLSTGRRRRGHLLRWGRGMGMLRGALPIEHGRAGIDDLLNRPGAMLFARAMREPNQVLI